MNPTTLKKVGITIAVILLFIGLWRWVLPVAIPFALGALIAMTAEPLVSLLSRRLPRGAAAGIGVTAALLGVLGILTLLTALLFRQLGQLTDHVPELIRSANEGLTGLHDTLTELSDRAPKSLQPMLSRTVDDMFSSSGTVVEGVLNRLPAAAGAVLSYVTNSALTVGTGCLAAYMISARMPKLRAWLSDPPPESGVGRLIPRLKRLRSALWGWLKAQISLSGMCFLILLVGFLLLGIPYSPVWAFLIALVDAVPLLGTGTVLIPWAIVSLLQKQSLRALGLLGIYAVTFLTRSALEPRLVGRQLGLDPLLTLASLYAGFQFWGVGGMLAAPVLCVIVKEVATGKAE